LIGHTSLNIFQIDVMFSDNILISTFLNVNQEKSVDNIVAWMVALTIDFLAKSMFNCDFGTLHHHAVQNGTAVKVPGEESEGYELVTKLNNVIRECTLLQALNPFRKYQFWNKEVSIAKTDTIDVQVYVC
jgi:hypothetical protein